MSVADEDLGIIPVDSGFRYSKGNMKPYSIHFCNVLQQNEITMEGEVWGGGDKIIYLCLRKTIIKIMTKLSCWDSNNI